MNDEANFRFGKIELYDNLVISEPSEGVTIDTAEIMTILDYCESRFKGRPYGYIGRRVKSYSVNPLIYMRTDLNYNVQAIAIVAQSKSATANANIESQFSSRSFKVFTDEEEAKNWINEILASSR